MRVVIQRVTEAAVSVNALIGGKIGKGLLILVGIEDADTIDDIAWLSNKIINLRIFVDETNAHISGQRDVSVKDINGDLLVVSQFTLHASTKKGNRPSYIKASKAEIAIPLYEAFVVQLSKDLGKKIHTGIFGADMKVELVNDGPVTIVINSKSRE